MIAPVQSNTRLCVLNVPASQVRISKMTDSWETYTNSEAETIELGMLIGSEILTGDIVLLLGQLGSGKTRLAKGITATAAGIPVQEVVSPTFTLINSFSGPVNIHHADMYRIDSVHVDDLGLDDYLEDGALLVEWAERLPDMADDALYLTISYTPDGDRRRIVFEWDPDGSWPQRMRNVIDLFSGNAVQAGTNNQSPEPVSV